MLYSSSRLMYR